MEAKPGHGFAMGADPAVCARGTQAVAGKRLAVLQCGRRGRLQPWRCPRAKQPPEGQLEPTGKRIGLLQPWWIEGPSSLLLRGRQSLDGQRPGSSLPALPCRWVLRPGLACSGDQRVHASAWIEAIAPASSPLSMGPAHPRDGQGALAIEIANTILPAWSWRAIAAACRPVKGCLQWETTSAGGGGG